MLYLALLLIVAACSVAVYRWRWGVFAAIIVGLLQDPIRKMIPGVPAFLAMASLPVWMATLASASFSGEIKMRLFLSGFPRLTRWISVFSLYLLIPAALSASYGRNSWMITALGVVIYSTAFFVLAAGWRFPATHKSISKVLSFYAVCAAILLIGGPLDYIGFGERFSAIGTQALDMIWVTYRTGSEGLFMYAGFFRSPDVMGWHAALVTMVAGLMAARSRGWVRVFWILISVWGFLNVWICGRRKMISMLPIFGGVFLLLTYKFRDVRKTALLGAGAFLVVALAWYGVSRTYRTVSTDTFYLSAFEQMDEKFMQHGVGSVITTVQQAGFLGYGLGMGQQGVHNINAEKPRLWQEGGPGKIFAELGVPGAILLLGIGFVLFRTAYFVVGYTKEFPVFYECAGLLSILVANVASAVVSAQIFGDPFIMLLLAFFMGLILSGSRISQDKDSSQMRKDAELNKETLRDSVPLR